MDHSFLQQQDSQQTPLFDTQTPTNQTAFSNTAQPEPIQDPNNQQMQPFRISQINDSCYRIEVLGELSYVNDIGRIGRQLQDEMRQNNHRSNPHQGQVDYDALPPGVYVYPSNVTLNKVRISQTETRNDYIIAPLRRNIHNTRPSSHTQQNPNQPPRRTAPQPTTRIWIESMTIRPSNQPFRN